MVQKLYAEIEINRPPEEVRGTLLEFSFKEWHEGFTVERISSGKAGIEKGDILSVNAGGKKFKVVVLENSPELFRWLGKMYGLLSGEHTFHFAPSTKTTNGTTLIQTEIFTGLLSFLFGPNASMGKHTQKQFEALNTSLKKKVEAKAAP